MYKFMLDDDEVNRIVYNECCDGMSCEDKLLNCVFAEGDTELLDTLISYIFSNKNRTEESISETYEHFSYYECENVYAKKEVSDIMEKYIKAIPNKVERGKCLGLFFETQCVLEDDDDDGFEEDDDLW